MVDFGDERLEITHWKFDELSLTWNRIDPVGKSSWDWGDPAEPSSLRWRQDVFPKLSALEGQVLQDVEFNAPDENGLEYTEPDSSYRRHSLAG
ncbi:hypothetical protein [Amycolatopsis sp. CB00013]|uniref:hypothetical protein n=1 Tax=Amycolatopsis sp. CB00013 TaxID=1703945 RepID=UPI001F51B11C|nr:hypothetical protein [Amycolatopsis sp. CB00013]